MHSDIRIGASHLGTLDVQRMEVKHMILEPSQKNGEWWTHLEDG